MSNYQEWDQYYREYPLTELGWELGRPRPILVEYMEEGLLPNRGKALDLCCGAGTNTVFLAKNGLDVTGIDISETAIGLARQKANQAGVAVNFLNESFIDLPFNDSEFIFVYDMGCFHHVEEEDRSTFIEGVSRVLLNQGLYMLTCFSYRNGPGWNHFTRQQIVDLFGNKFDIYSVRHYSSLEGDDAVRFFYTVLMKKKIVR